MIFVSICIGSSCHLKGSEELVTLFQNKIQTMHLEDEIVLSGRFCLGKCNREGVTVSIDDGNETEILVGITPQGFESFFAQQILPRLPK